MKCRKCQSVMDASDKFCSHCGEPINLMRSENAIIAELEALNNIPPDPNIDNPIGPILDLMLLGHLMNALDWVRGSANAAPPSEMILASRKRKTREVRP